jgi:hypothetical protein
MSLFDDVPSWVVSTSNMHGPFEAALIRDRVHVLAGVRDAALLGQRLYRYG